MAPVIQGDAPASMPILSLSTTSVLAPIMTTAAPFFEPSIQQQSFFADALNPAGPVGIPNNQPPPIMPMTTL